MFIDKNNQKKNISSPVHLVQISDKFACFLGSLVYKLRCVSKKYTTKIVMKTFQILTNFQNLFTTEK